jgi:hypothetical protein
LACFFYNLPIEGWNPADVPDAEYPEEYLDEEMEARVPIAHWVMNQLLAKYFVETKTSDSDVYEKKWETFLPSEDLYRAWKNSDERDSKNKNSPKNIGTFEEMFKKAIPSIKFVRTGTGSSMTQLGEWNTCVSAFTTVFPHTAKYFYGAKNRKTLQEEMCSKLTEDNWHLCYMPDRINGKNVKAELERLDEDGPTAYKLKDPDEINEYGFIRRNLLKFLVHIKYDYDNTGKRLATKKAVERVEIPQVEKPKTFAEIDEAFARWNDYVGATCLGLLLKEKDLVQRMEYHDIQPDRGIPELLRKWEDNDRKKKWTEGKNKEKKWRLERDRKSMLHYVNKYKELLSILATEMVSSNATAERTPLAFE